MMRSFRFLFQDASGATRRLDLSGEQVVDKLSECIPGREERAELVDDIEVIFAPTPMIALIMEGESRSGFKVRIWISRDDFSDAVVEINEEIENGF